MEPGSIPAEFEQGQFKAKQGRCEGRSRITRPRCTHERVRESAGEPYSVTGNDLEHID